MARDDFEDADQLRIGNDGIFMLTFFSKNLKSISALFFFFFCLSVFFFFCCFLFSKLTFSFILSYNFLSYNPHSPPISWSKVEYSCYVIIHVL